LDPDGARAVVDAVLSSVDDGLVELSDSAAVRLLSCYGIEIVPHRVVTSADDAVAAAEELGYPVAVKATGERWWRRPDLEGVRLDLATPEAVRAAHDDLSVLTGVANVYVQRMARKGLGCSIGLQDDPSFGTLVSFGLSGVVSDLLGDRAYRAVPLTDTDAAALVRAPKAAPLLTGYRGSEPADLGALADLVLRVAALAEDVPQVRWLALEPILAAPAGAQAVGARVKVGAPPSQQDIGPRQLRSLEFLRK
jgi:acyl-CoA synthetase (NDP forming)